MDLLISQSTLTRSYWLLNRQSGWVRIYYTYILFDLLIHIRAGLAGVAQPGQSVRLIIERSRAQIPPPALFFGFSMLNRVKSIKDHAIFINNAVS